MSWAEEMGYDRYDEEDFEQFYTHKLIQTERINETLKAVLGDVSMPFGKFKGHSIYKVNTKYLVYIYDNYNITQYNENFLLILKLIVTDYKLHEQR